MTMKKRLSRKVMTSAAMATVLVTALAGTAWALANLELTLGTVAGYDFGAFGPGYPVPGTIQIHAFTLRPGDTVPWHFHKAASYVILARGTVTEQHVVGPNACASEDVPAGSAFVEPPGLVHSVTNTGQDSAVIWWATIFPQSDGIVRFLPEFKAGGVYVVNAPTCN